MTWTKGKTYTVAQEELSRALSSQQTISVKKLTRLLNKMNISVQPGNSSENTEIAYLKSEIRKRDKKLSAMGERLKKLKGAKQ